MVRQRYLLGKSLISAMTCNLQRFEGVMRSKSPRYGFYFPLIVRAKFTAMYLLVFNVSNVSNCWKITDLLTSMWLGNINISKISLYDIYHYCYYLFCT